jgi:hypothetical protein
MTTTRRSLALAIGMIGAVMAAAPASATAQPSGQRAIGSGAGGAVVEPAYDESTGRATYILTPAGSRSASKSSQTGAPLYIVVYPAGYPGWTLDCMGVPGNCPDHDGPIATAATTVEPGVYGTVPSGVPGHDHLIGLSRTGGDSSVERHVWVVLFTNKPAANTHIRTLSQLRAALTSGDAISFDSGIVIHAAAVSAATYWNGTPL